MDLGHIDWVVCLYCCHTLPSIAVLDTTYKTSRRLYDSFIRKTYANTKSCHITVYIFLHYFNIFTAIHIKLNHFNYLLILWIMLSMVLVFFVQNNILSFIVSHNRHIIATIDQLLYRETHVNVLVVKNSHTHQLLRNVNS